LTYKPEGVFETLKIHGYTVKELMKIMEQDEKPQWFLDACERGRKSIERIEREEHEKTAQKVPFHMIGAYSNLKRHDFETSKLEDLSREKRPYLQAALKKVEKWSPKIRKGFYFYGNPGSGKTRLLKGLGLKWALKGVTVQFWPVTELIAAFKKFDLGSAQMDAIRKKIVEAQILILDDFGTEGTTEFVSGELLRIIDERSSRYPGSLHISSNMHPKMIGDEYGLRITDRLKDLVQSMELNDPSYRGKTREDDTGKFWDEE
jgi:DNA replication protein DnaC